MNTIGETVTTPKGPGVVVDSFVDSYGPTVVVQYDSGEQDVFDPDEVTSETPAERDSLFSVTVEKWCSANPADTDLLLAEGLKVTLWNPPETTEFGRRSEALISKVFVLQVHEPGLHRIASPDDITRWVADQASEAMSTWLDAQHNKEQR